VQYLLNGNAIEEKWNGVVKFYWEGMTDTLNMSGYSLRYYDEKIEKWIIHWLDETNPRISEPFIGTFVTDSLGYFYREIPSQSYRSRIIFKLISEKTVFWQLDISKDNKIWHTIWKMEMNKK
jgi:hypothetical protein